MFLNLLVILPKVFTIGQDILNCLDGDVTQEDWNKVVDDLGDIALSYPPAAGFVAITQSVINVSKILFPVIESLLESKDKVTMQDIADAVGAPDATKRMMASAFTSMGVDSIDKEGFKRAKNALSLMEDVSKKVADSKVAEPEVDQPSNEDDWKEKVLNPE